MSSRATLVTQLRDLGVEPGSVLLVHTAFGSIAPVDGGPDAFIDALVEARGPEGTLVMPSWTDEDDEPFDPLSTDVEDHLGVVADTFWRRPGVVRGDHPFAVAALGPLADEVAGAPFVLPPHGPGSGIDRVHDLDGWVLLAGVDHDANTTIHLAELAAGAPYRQPKHITVLEDGGPKRIDYGENDSCCRGFVMAGGWLRGRGLLREGLLAGGRGMLARSRDVVATVVDELRDDPCRFLCERGTCDECDRSWASVVESQP
ncbi:MAG: AAC(3) family N-acetyltransferase [Candidatus Binatia bacterium]